MKLKNFLGIVGIHNDIRCGTKTYWENKLKGL